MREIPYPNFIKSFREEARSSFNDWIFSSYVLSEELLTYDAQFRSLVLQEI